MRPLPLLRHHFVSKRKYHMIIPMDVEWNKPVEDGVFDLQTHLLHGLIHCNGFGHLLCINGIEGGSKFLCGREIMDLWDRICTNLHARYLKQTENYGLETFIIIFRYWKVNTGEA
ncbi:PHD finger protein MALE MEIOCYTE DEATH 1-like isoform X3 [Actinidia eriantha]|uniref:PHD finger protein MALE MEIOCYTE DEATH 1-like isoform X3 n=1 Tax=Actinidia eriantha TaxID=165200 RepID=UPI00258EADC0|nr:PHD finger protein MALE MEIOCYTE DEATH 1-like isoform X3 [Actinidia eriantha]